MKTPKPHRVFFFFLLPAFGTFSTRRGPCGSAPINTGAPDFVAASLLRSASQAARRDKYVINGDLRHKDVKRREIVLENVSGGIGPS